MVSIQDHNSFIDMIYKVIRRAFNEELICWQHDKTSYTYKLSHAEKKTSSQNKNFLSYDDSTVCVVESYLKGINKGVHWDILAVSSDSLPFYGLYVNLFPSK